jgi:hypothetical protein
MPELDFDPWDFLPSPDEPSPPSVTPAIDGLVDLTPAPVPSIDPRT